MTPKESIKPLPDDKDRPFEHLLPIVEALLAEGNKSQHPGLFVLEKDGWRCDLMHPIDFGFLEKHFSFPRSIRLSRKYGSILDELSWIEIKGGVGPRGGSAEASDRKMVKITSMPEVYSLVDKLRAECKRHKIERVGDELDDAMALGSSGLEILGAIRSVLVGERHPRASDSKVDRYNGSFLIQT